jgi:hypothetical protein
MAIFELDLSIFEKFIDIIIIKLEILNKHKTKIVRIRKKDEKSNSVIMLFLYPKINIIEENIVHAFVNQRAIMCYVFFVIEK